MNITILTTEGDCEGRSTQIVGYFIGSLSQIMTYCVKNNIRPTYNFHTSSINIKDVSKEPSIVKCHIGEYGRLIYNTPEELEIEAKKNLALSKLTKEEKTLLGLSE